MAAKVEQAGKACASAEQNRDTNENAMAKARSHFRETQREHFVRFPSGCPWDNDAAAASNRDASGYVAMGEVDGMVIELPDDTDSIERLKRKCNNSEEKWESKLRNAEKSIWRAARQLPKTAEGRRAFDQIVADEECPSSE